MKKPADLRKSIVLGLAIIVGLVIYAYGFVVTEVNLGLTRDPQRQTSIVRVLRALGHPDIIAYEQAEVVVEVPIMIPCPAGGYEAPEPDMSGPYLIVTPPCGSPGETVVVEGYNFALDTTGPIRFIPTGGANLNAGQLETDPAGYFRSEVELRDRQSEEAQIFRAITRKNVGAPYFTQNAIDTWDKIIETVFMALLATTLGTALAVPISFLAARNLMKDVTSTLGGLALSILSWPIGIWVGVQVANWIGRLSLPVSASLLIEEGTRRPLIINLLPNLLGFLIASVIVYFLVRWAMPSEEVQKPSLNIRIARIGALFVAGTAFIFGLFLLARLMQATGMVAAYSLGAAGFMGEFLSDLGDILDLLVSALVGLAGGAVLSSVVGRFGRDFYERASKGTRFIFNLVLGAAAGAALLVMIMLALDWFYHFKDPLIVYVYPATLGALLGILAAVRTRTIDKLPVGLVVYNATRTALNALRAIEALIMAIVFAVWVGIGPFAGVLALSLHTIAALGKLFSEQVESISPGPLEAVRATGATRLQTIIYAVIPQIVPPYISFTMYRWDINVRMSTIIGLAGGGGIGFLLQQNINLLRYRHAATQMLAIAIVVSLMDYLSSYLRQRVV